MPKQLDLFDTTGFKQVSCFYSPCPLCGVLFPHTSPYWTDNLALHLVRKHKDFKQDIELIKPVLLPCPPPNGVVVECIPPTKYTPLSNKDFETLFKRVPTLRYKATSQPKKIEPEIDFG